MFLIECALNRMSGSHATTDLCVKRDLLNLLKRPTVASTWYVVLDTWYIIIIIFFFAVASTWYIVLDTWYIRPLIFQKICQAWKSQRLNVCSVKSNVCSVKSL